MIAALVVIAAFTIWIRCGAVPPDLLDGVAAPSTLVLDRHGRVLYEALTVDGARVQALDAASLPPVLAAATIAAEDRRFYAHAGVDPLSLVRAARHNLLEGRVVEGGSTITQQVAKLLIQRREGIHPRGMPAKIREMVLALRLEHRFTKREILALYLNLAAYGNQAVGAGRASRAYFGVDASMLTPAQAAFLAALPQRPSAFNPWKNVTSARRRQQTVLLRMAAADMLTPEQLREARDERLTLRPRAQAFSAPHFVEMIKSASALRASAGSPSASLIKTTLDLDLQQDVEGVIDHERAALKLHGAANVAVVVLDNKTSEWLAWEGSGDYTDVDHGGAINGPVVPRQPGSALKPFTYALAFEQGRTPATVLPDIPASFPTAEPGVVYSPRNYDGQYRGPLLARRALAGSENIPAVALASELGVDTLLRFLSRAGLTTFDRAPSYYGLGLTLGNAEVRLDELVAAYATFARGGVWLKPTWTLPSGGAPEGAPYGVRVDGAPETRRLVSERTAFWITDILSDDEARAFIFGRGSSLEFPFPVAVKTGTSQAYHDNWTIGYTRDVTVGVWVGNFDRTPLRTSSGVTGAGPIFHAVMLAAERRYAGDRSDAALVARPADLEEVTICTLSGKRATPWCPSRAREWVPAGADLEPCDWHHGSSDRSGGVVTSYPAEFRAWARAESGSPGSLGSPGSRGSGSRGSSGSGSQGSVRPTELLNPQNPNPANPGNPVNPVNHLTIASPPAGAIYSIDPTLRREFQALALRVVTERPTTVTWTIDGATLATASSERSVDWPLVVGSHQIEVRDTGGRSARTSVVVK